MKTLYAACISRLGLSLAEAARLHEVDLSTVKHWSSGRRVPPPDVWDELRSRESAIVDASEAMLAAWEAAGSPPIELDDSEADDLALMAAADFVLATDGPVHVGQTPATQVARQARRPN